MGRNNNPGGIVKRSGPPELVEGLAMVCSFAIAKAFGLDAATRTHDVLNPDENQTCE